MPSREIVFVEQHARQGGKFVWRMGKLFIFVTFAQSITYEWIIL